ncbi:hypothetical protein [Rufibacter sp. LB8]|uniref:hypothetical protein n=1 Tax=Rufibacter sp. LB8 TaxID=2777781 RepID=UPI00178C4D61|nr:hypothetical protein [Rufibacter sp. LB8]
MDLPSLRLSHEFEPIPKLFHSTATGQCFTHCVTCNKALLQDGTPYLVEKAVRNYPGTGVHDILLEYAMCLGCAEQLRQELSVESKTRIDAYMAKNVDLAARREALVSLPDPFLLDNWLANCLVTGEPVNKCTEYQIFAQCDGPDLLYGYMPYVLSEQAMSQIQELISPHTRQILDDFMDTHFGLPPELRALLQDRLVLI